MSGTHEPPASLRRRKNLGRLAVALSLGGLVVLAAHAAAPAFKDFVGLADTGLGALEKAKKDPASMQVFLDAFSATVGAHTGVDPKVRLRQEGGRVVGIQAEQPGMPAAAPKLDVDVPEGTQP